MEVIRFLVIAAWVLAPIAALVATARNNRRVRDLEAELVRLKARLEGGAPAAPLPAGSPTRDAPAASKSPLPAAWPPSLAQPAAPERLAPSARSAASAASARAASAAPSARALESFLGGRVLLVVGVVTVLFALGFFLKIAIERGWVGPAGRLVMGGLAGAALLVGGDRLVRRGLLAFGAALMGAGLGAFYLVNYFASERYGFVERPPAFALAAVLTAAGALLGVRRRQPLLVWLGFLGGFLAPALLGRDVDALLALTGWLLVLDAGLLAVRRYRDWPGLDLLALGAAAAYVLGWHERFGQADDAWLRGGLALGALMLAVLVLALLPGTSVRRPISGWSLGAVGGALLLALLLGLLVLGPEHRRAHGAGILVLGLLPALCAARALGRSGAAPAARAEASALAAFAAAALAMAVPLLLRDAAVAPGWSAVGAAAIYAGGRRRLPALQGAGLAALVLACGHVLLFEGPMQRAWWSPSASWPRDAGAELPHFLPLLNVTFLSALSPAVALLASARWLLRAPADGESGAALACLLAGTWLPALLLGHELYDAFGPGSGVADSAARARGLSAALAGVAVYALALARLTSGRGGLAAALVLPPLAGSLGLGLALLGAGHPPNLTPVVNVAFGALLAGVVACLFAAHSLAGVPGRVCLWAGMLLLVLSVSAEIEAWGRLAPQGPGATRAELVFRARVALSAVWALLAGGFVALGFRARSADWRWGGLLLFAATVVKVFLVDMETLQTGYRVGAFLALGVLMVGTSFFYQRGMRDGAGPDAA